MRVLITGGGGMVGRNLQDYLASKGYEIFVPNSKELDLCNYTDVEEYLQVVKPDFVIHAAGKVGGIQANMREPVEFLMKNLDMGRNIVWASKSVGVRRLINLGSSCMYPRGYNSPLREDQVLSGELEPTNEGYALAKVVVSRLCGYISAQSPDYQYKTIIPCNLYGQYDKFDPAHSHLIPAIIHKVYQAKINNEPTVEIWGDGTARREFMFAGDLADCLVEAVVRFETLPALMNVGLGYDYTINEYYQAVADVMDYKGSFHHDLTKPVGMARKLVSVEKQVSWGWQPKHDLKSGIEKTFKFYLQEMVDEL
ncbi:GDP-L-fucose synthase [Vogesella sp. XCS3]|uniref:GDP-L-fucose synthase family protein n=1 Tax=Vogesella sp. XCS3 TaxID=2877939 RepID=UPI001D0BB60E|nr:GDP-L-fucose synthase [Vogesella sp. XCS3]UDM16692.1 GDP-L-fucose synthase [Vogesella sp. XCS3]